MAITWVQIFRKGQGMGSEYIEEQATIYTDVAAADDGEWWSTAGLISLTVEIADMTTGTVKIGTSFVTDKPAATEDGTDAVTAPTAAGITGIEGSKFGRWAKIHQHALTTGTPTIKAIRRRYIGV